MGSAIDNLDHLEPLLHPEPSSLAGWYGASRLHCRQHRHHQHRQDCPRFVFHTLRSSLSAPCDLSPPEPASCSHLWLMAWWYHVLLPPHRRHRQHRFLDRDPTCGGASSGLERPRRASPLAPTTGAHHTYLQCQRNVDSKTCLTSGLPRFPPLSRHTGTRNQHPPPPTATSLLRTHTKPSVAGPPCDRTEGSTPFTTDDSALWREQDGGSSIGPVEFSGGGYRCVSRR